MIRERNEQTRPGILEALDQSLRFPIQKRPLCSEILVAKLGGVSIFLHLEFVVVRAFCVHSSCVPVAKFRNALRTPMRPYTELCIAIPLGYVVLQQGIPGRLIRAFTTQPTYGSLHRYAIPGAAGQLWRLTPCSWCPVCIVKFGLDDLAIYKGVEDAFVLRSCAEFFISLLKFVEASRRVQSWLSFCGDCSGRRGSRDQLAEVSSLHFFIAPCL